MILPKNGSITVDISIPVAETLAIWKALKHAIQEKTPRVFIENDSLLVIQAINGNTLLPFHISNLVENIKNLAQEIDNNRILYCRKSANKMADRITKRYSHACTFKFCYQ